MLNTLTAQLMVTVYPELNTHTHSANKLQMPIFQMVSLLSTQAYLYLMNKIHTI